MVEGGHRNGRHEEENKSPPHPAKNAAKELFTAFRARSPLPVNPDPLVYFGWSYFHSRMVAHIMPRVEIVLTA